MCVHFGPCTHAHRTRQRGRRWRGGDSAPQKPNTKLSVATGHPPSESVLPPGHLPGHLAGRVSPALLASPLLFCCFCCCCDVYVLKLAWPPEVSDSVPLPLPEVFSDGNPLARRTDCASTSLNRSKHAKNRLFPGQIIPPKLSPESSHSLLQLKSQTPNDDDV